MLAPTIVIAMIGVVDRHATLPWLGHQGWYALLVDVFCVLVLVGVLAALWIRKVAAAAAVRGQPSRRSRPDPRADRDDRDRLLLWHASRIALGLNEWPRDWAPVSHLLSHLFGRGGATRVLERVFVWIHVLTILTFLAYLPHSKHLHIATAAINVWFGRTAARGRLEPLRFDPRKGRARRTSGSAPARPPI